MKKAKRIAQKSKSNRLLVRSKRMPGPKYLPATATDSQGLQKEVLLIDINDPVNERLLTDSKVNPELQADVHAALRTFRPKEQLVIVRVLLKGQSVREATKRMKGSTRHWETWLYYVALPSMRRALADYATSLRGRKVAVTILPPQEIAPSESAVERVKCRLCPAVFDGRHAMAKLRKHGQDEHLMEVAGVQPYVRARDYEIVRDQQALMEVPGGNDASL